MKLRNKKTGEIVEFGYLQSDYVAPLVLTTYENDKPKMYSYASLAELNAEWEDYKEPKGYWYIRDGGNIDHNLYGKSIINRHKEIGNYFETKEEAEKAVEKLKAWKRLKDKGSKIIDYECYGGTNTKGEFSGEVKVTIDVPQVDKYLFKMLFGDEG